MSYRVPLGLSWQVVNSIHCGKPYASNTVVHVLTGHVYAHALRAHLISSAAIISILLERPGCISEINLDKLRIMHQALLKGDISTDSVENEECVQQITNTIDNLDYDNATKSRLAQMWMNYVNISQS